jgi:hypothetical protein
MMAYYILSLYCNLICNMYTVNCNLSLYCNLNLWLSFLKKEKGMFSEYISGDTRLSTKTMKLVYKKYIAGIITHT